MNWKTLFLGISAGFAAGYATKQVLEQTGNHGPSPEKVLSTVKERVKKDGSIHGSWIVMKPENYEKNGLDYEVYKGGITRNTDGKREQFDFVADSSTGTILELTARPE
ncbi:PepSY domain-containing protein [Bacillus massiliglaciei]|uniref:PepSY domain-containing protein n=1 Tax=Bacillus massiliglaciei TaxID=1816693 RepID=UPI000DA6237F|nr:PepSY domain-containing protein [Bacillus massiliglaciei]